MANISDVIEAFLLDTIGSSPSVIISRNELANYFACAPSQINYVLSTRFTPDRGFIIESRRGGGGSITLVRIKNSPESLLREILQLPPNTGLTAQRAAQIVDRMRSEGLVTANEARLITAALGDKALVAPAVAKDGLRVGILKGIAAELLKGEIE